MHPIAIEMAGCLVFVVFVCAVFLHQARDRADDEFRGVCAGDLEFTRLDAKGFDTRPFGDDLFHVRGALVNQSHGV